MSILKYDQMNATTVRPGVVRRLGFTNNLMMTVFDFDNGPSAQPDPLHSHPHEQITYVAEGEINFILGEESAHLKPGDVILVPSEIPHSIQLLTGHVRLVDCFTPIRQDFLS
jgi:quercetin dioxygenase-like cupin family protein